MSKITIYSMIALSILHRVTAIDLSACNVVSQETILSNFMQINEDHPLDRFSRRLAEETVNPAITSLTDKVTLKLHVLPGDGYFSPTALGIFLRAESSASRVYYTLDGTAPTLQGSRVLYSAPYVHVDTPYKVSRRRRLRAVAAEVGVDGFLYRSEEVDYRYVIEASDRPDAFGFFVPGVEGSGYFVRLGIEIAAAARAQVSGNQEFADFNTTLGLGPYSTQLRLLHLPSIDPDLLGFEGGFFANVSGHQYGFLVPNHNKKKFFGKLVRVDLLGMEDEDACMASVREERYDSNGNLLVSGVDEDKACITVIDLSTLDPYAVGFNRGFVGYPYAYLSPGHYDVAIRISLLDFGLHSTKHLPLREASSELGGYSGGFKDDTWACYCPMKSFVGPVGGIRSNYSVDRHHLKAYYHGVVMCINESAWTTTESKTSLFGTQIRTFDFADALPALRGFSDVIVVGRYAYFAPFGPEVHTYASRLIRLDLGFVNVIDTYDAAVRSGGDIRNLIDVMDLTQANPGLGGFSGIFNAGKYLYLVPWRAKNELFNGQRGHGLVPRIDLNVFDKDGVVTMDMPTTKRTQIPSFPDIELIGYSGGFASGKYGLFVPFYNGVFSGKVGRINILDWDNLQEVDLKIDKVYPNILKGFRGGFSNYWQGSYDDATTIALGFD